MAKGVRLGNLSVRVERMSEILAEKIDKRAAAGYYNRPRPAKPAYHLIILPSGVAKRVKS